MAPKIGKFAKRTIAAKRMTQSLPGMINSRSVAKAVGEAITKAARAPGARRSYGMGMPIVTLIQPPPYAAKKYKK